MQCYFGVFMSKAGLINSFSQTSEYLTIDGVFFHLADVASKEAPVTVEDRLGESVQALNFKLSSLTNLLKSKDEP